MPFTSPTSSENFHWTSSFLQPTLYKYHYDYDYYYSYTSAIATITVVTHLDETSSEERYNNCNSIDSELELKEFSDAVVDVAAPHHRLHNAREIVVCQNDVRRFLCNISTCDSLQHDSISMTTSKLCSQQVPGYTLYPFDTVNLAISQDNTRGASTSYHMLHCHHFWLAPPRVHSPIHNQQPPERTILIHIDCFNQCKIMGLEVIYDCLHPCDPRTTGQSLPNFLWECSHHLLSISTVI